MANTKITERDILNMMLDGTIDGDLMAEFAAKKLAQMDKRNESAKKRAEKKRAEADVLLEKVQAVLSEEPMTRDQVLEMVTADGTVAKLGQITNRLSRLCKENTVQKGKEKYKGEDGKQHEITVYYLA
jgi:hypothetical protein